MEGKKNERESERENEREGEKEEEREKGFIALTKNVLFLDGRKNILRKKMKGREREKKKKTGGRERERNETSKNVKGSKVESERMGGKKNKMRIQQMSSLFLLEFHFLISLHPIFFTPLLSTVLSPFASRKKTPRKIQ